MVKKSKPTQNEPRPKKTHLSKEVQARLSAFVNSSTEGFALLDENLNYMFINPTAERMAGVSREAVVGKNVLDVVPDIKESGRYDKYRSVLKTGAPIYIEDMVSQTKYRDIHASLKAFRVESWLGLVFTDITVRKRAEEEVESLAKFPSENPCPVLRVAKDGRVLYSNKAALELFTEWKIKIGEKVPERWCRLIEEAFESGELRIEEEEVNGKIFSLEIVLIKESGYVNLYGHDITEHKKAEEALRHSEEYFRALIENARDAIVILNGDGTMRYGSPSIERIWGYEVGDWSNRDYSEFVSPDDMQNAADAFAILLRNPGSRIYTEMHVRHKNGSIHVIEALGKNLLDNPSINGIVINVRDITERKKAEEALRESEEKYRDLFNNAEVALFRSRIADGQILECNDLLAKLFGYDSREQCVAEHIASEHYVDHGVRAQILTQMLENGKVENFEVQVTRRDGSPFWVSYSAHMYPEENFIEGAIVDITERKKLEEQERRRSHDLNLLSKAAMSLVELPADADIYHFIAERLRELTQGSFILVNSFDEALGAFRVREALGAVEQTEAVNRILGFNLVGMPAPIDDEARRGLSSGKVEKVPDGVYALASGALPMTVCQDVENLLNVGNVYAIGFHWEGKLYGSAAILTRDRTELRNKDVIQTFVRQVSIALQRRRAEEALKESEEKYRALIEAAGRAGEGIIIVQDSDEREAAFVFANDEFCKMSGYSREELLTRSAWDLVSPEFAELLKNWYKRRHLGESLPGHYEAAGVRKDGGIVPLDLSVVTMLWQGKIATVLYLRDITERKDMEEALRESEQTIRQLAKASASAHEEERQRVALEVHDRISQTLTGAFHQLQALESIPTENTEAQQILKRASTLLRESIRESRSIMEDLYSPVLSDFGIVVVIDEELRRFQEDTGCSTKFDKRCIVRPTPEVELTVYRIFREALTNIKKHAIGATEVKVSLSGEADMVSLEVKDNGPGFDVKAAMVNKRLGGLRGMQRRAELGGGTFEVVSRRGHGATVTVRIPYISETSAADEGKGGNKT